MNASTNDNITLRQSFEDDCWIAEYADGSVFGAGETIEKAIEEAKIFRKMWEEVMAEEGITIVPHTSSRK